MGGRRFASVSAATRDLRQRPRGSVAVALGADARRALALAPLDRRIDLQELHRSAGVLCERVHADDDSLARLHLGLEAERRRFDLGLDEALLDRGDRATELVDASDQLRRPLARARR